MNAILVSSCLLLLALVATTSSAQDIVTGNRLSTFSTTPAVCTAADSGMKCETCDSVLICQGATPITTTKCASPKIYCDTKTNSCTDVKPAEDTCGSTFVCPAEGYFPDPNNCDVYYFCTADKASTAYKCPTNYVFDITNSGCKKKVYATDCATMKCAKEGDYLVYSKDASVWAYCPANLAPVIFKCPTSQTFDKTVNRCAFICKKEGYSAGSTPNTAYFCYRDGVTLKYVELECPTGYEYNASFACIKSAVTPAPAPATL